MDWSYDLLNAAEQSFSKIIVFVGDAL